MKHKNPTSTSSKAVTLAPESAKSDSLHYENLGLATVMQPGYENQNLNYFGDAENDSLEELELAKQAALQYLNIGTTALQDMVSLDSEESWSKCYTQIVSEKYGIPDAAEAMALDLGAEINDSLESAAAAMGDYIKETYGPVLGAVEAKVAGLEILEPEDVAQAFEAGLSVLANQYDPAWNKWNVYRDEKKESLSVVSERQIIKVGMHRPAMQAKQLKPLFTHETLFHAQRALNGFKVNKELGSGLPDYLYIEEGLGVFSEYALTGEIPQKNIDRYTDIAYALGQIDGKPHNRTEMLERVVNRALERNQELESKKTYETIIDESHAHVNRIYRSPLGEENVHAFTKDIVYHKGFLRVGEYINRELQAGKKIEAIMQFLLQGKFDPTNQSHLNYLKKLKS